MIQLSLSWMLLFAYSSFQRTPTLLGVKPQEYGFTHQTRGANLVLKKNLLLIFFNIFFYFKMPLNNPLPGPASFTDHCGFL